MCYNYGNRKERKRIRTENRRPEKGKKVWYIATRTYASAKCEAPPKLHTIVID
jgi:hypothetical protein